MSISTLAEKHRKIAGFYDGLNSLLEEARDNFCSKNGISVEEVALPLMSVVDDAQVSKKPKAKSSGRKVSNKSKTEAIKNYLEKNPDVMPKQAVVDLNSEGWEVTPTLISSLKTRIKKGIAPKRTRGLSLGKMIVQALSDSKEGLSLAQLTVEVKKLGYKYTGSKGTEGETSAVYQSLHELMTEKKRPDQEGKAALVIKDEETKNYQLNEKVA